MLVNVSNLTIKYLDKALISDSSFIINDFDKIGLVGNNGTGKTSIVKAILGEIEYSGIISKRKDLKIAYLPQERNFDLSKNALEEFMRYTKAQDFEARAQLSKYNLDESIILKDASGGEKKRLSIAIALYESCDLLIMDEPTNHLDIMMIDMLEKLLIKFNKGLLLITHDRYFLERVTKKILEIDYGKLYMYEGSYSTYLVKKAERFNDLLARERKLAALYKKEAAWAAMNPQARTTKSTERLARFEELEETLSDVNNQISYNDKINLSSIQTRMGKTTIEIDDISKEIEERMLFKSFSYNMPKFDRLGIVGDNGAGKSTLLKIIAGLLKPTSGSIKIGTTINIGYFNQEGLEFDENETPLNILKEAGEYIRTPNGTLSASQLLELYGFTPNMMRSAISRLSGGEKRRLQLLTVLVKNPNVLLLDEPTNDLDINTLETLEDYLDSFVGAVLVISHDRYFLDKIANHLLVFKNSNIEQFNGIVSDYIDISKNNIEVVEKVKKEKKVENTDIPRFTSKEKKEFDNILDVIESIENDIKLLKEEMGLYSTDYTKLLELDNKIKEKEKELEEKLERWEYLSELNEKIEEYKKNKYNL